MNASPGTRAGALVLLGAWTLALLAAARPVPVPEALKAAGGLAAVLVFPGWAWGRLLVRRDHGELAAAGLAIPLGLAHTLAIVGLGAVLNGSLIALCALQLFAGFGVLVAGVLRPGAASAPGFPVRIAVVVAAIGIGFTVWAGGPTDPVTDGPDHVSTIGEIVRTGELFPGQGLIADGELDRSDPRKGIGHVVFGLAAVLAGAEATTLWRVLPAVLTAPFLMLVLLLAVRMGLGSGGAVLAALLTLVFLGGGGAPWVLRLGYGAHLGLVVAWAGWWAVIALLDRPDRRTAVLLAILAGTAGAVHPLAPGLLLPAVLGAAVQAVGGKSLFRAGVVIIAAGLGAVPAVAVRWLETRGPINPLHLQTMPVLELGGGSVLWPPTVVHVLGGVGIAGLLVTPWVLRRFGSPARGVVLAAAVVPVAITLVPGVFDAAARWTSSLPIKSLYLAPWPFAMGALLSTGWRGRGVTPRVAAVLVLLAGLPGAMAGFRPGPGLSVSDAALLEDLRGIPGRVVVAADPWLSSRIAAETAHFPVTVLHQHGHPLDPRGQERLDGLGIALSPWTSLRTTLEVLDRYRVSHVALDDPAGRPLEVGFGAARGGPLDALRRQKFQADPGVFRPRGSSGRLLRVDRDGAEELDAPPAVPLPEATEGRRVPVEDGTALGARLVTITMGDTLVSGALNDVTFGWERGSNPVEGPVELHLRFTRIGAAGGVKLWSRIRARLGSASSAERYRATLAPFLGAHPPSAWPADRRLGDRVRLWLPPDLAPGAYTVSARVLERPMFTRVAWQDIWSYEDRWQGSVVDTVRILGELTRGSEGQDFTNP